MLALSRPQVILLLIFFGPCLCSVTDVTVKLPDDEIFRKHQFVYMSIESMPKIDSVTSSPNPELFDADNSSAPHRIVFKPELLHGATYRLLVSSGPSSHTVNLNVERIPINVITSSVFLTGTTESVNKLLNSLKTSIRIISKMPVGDGSNTEAAVQVAKLGSTTEFMPLWEAYEWLLTNIRRLESSVELMPDKCEGSPQLCRSRLIFANEHPTVQDAVVKLGGSDNFLGFKLSWAAQTVEQMHAEPCGPATCLNGGVCDTTFKGVGFRCKCRHLPNIPWGPRCEYPTRAYDNFPRTNIAYTLHWIGDLPHSTKSLEFSFDMAGSTQHSGDFFALSDSRNTPLISLFSEEGGSNVTVSGSLLQGKMEMDVQFNVNVWTHMLLLLSPNNVTMVICQLYPRSLMVIRGCVQDKLQMSKPLPTGKTFRNLWLEIGKGSYGCFQSVTVNGYTVDLAEAKKIGNESMLSLTCHLQTYGCSYDLRYGYKCGPYSVCYSTLGRGMGTMCRCKCMGSRRMVTETVTAASTCSNELIYHNSCSQETLVLSTPKSDAKISWVRNGNKPVPLKLEEGGFYFEALIRTRKTEALEVLSASEIWKKPKAQSYWVVQISNGIPNLCSNGTVGTLSPRCWKFPPIRMDDGEWHSILAAIKLNILYLVSDGVSSQHLLDSVQKKPPNEVMLSASLPESNLRNIRVSGIYMSTTSNKTDRSEDIDKDEEHIFVVPIMTEGVSVSADGVDPAPQCDKIPKCSGSNEECVHLWGKNDCECRHGYERDSKGLCVAVNPCKKYTITCPFGVKCSQDSVDPGFKCECPVGFTSRLIPCKLITTTIVSPTIDKSAAAPTPITTGRQVSPTNDKSAATPAPITTGRQVDSTNDKSTAALTATNTDRKVDSTSDKSTVEQDKTSTATTNGTHVDANNDKKTPEQKNFFLSLLGSRLFLINAIAILVALILCSAIALFFLVCRRRRSTTEESNKQPKQTAEEPKPKK